MYVHKSIDIITFLNIGRHWSLSKQYFIFKIVILYTLLISKTYLYKNLKYNYPIFYRHDV